MTALLSSADYPAVRAAIDVSLGKSELPDDTIALGIYHAAAVQEVLARDPDAESRTGDELARVQRAAVYFCAARLCPAVVRLTSLSIQTRDISYSKPAQDPDERAAELRALAEAEIAAVLTPSEDDYARPTMFAVAKGYRGR
jgi:hypothetical protein